jgi:NADH-quinone oxidoreductase subunit L
MFLFDVVTCVMLVVVTFISFLVHVYSLEYMGYDPSFNRFMSYLSLFTFFMLLLVTADNFIQMFIGWEGVGLSSYLLISFWYSRILANKAAIKAMLVNRVGDLALLIAISVIFMVSGTVKYTVLFNVSSYFHNSTIEILNMSFSLFSIICLFLFFGAMGKSAQLGLHM